MSHIPVLQKEIIEYLNPGENENYIDCTIGDGGHAMAIIEKTDPKGKLLGIDWDEENIKELKAKIQKTRFKDRLMLACDNYSNLQEIVLKKKLNKIKGIIFDLGMSSKQLEESGRGFTFQKNEPLDMRYNIKNPITAEKIVNYWSKTEIERILREFGEEFFAREIAEAIVEERVKTHIENTSQLVRIIKGAVNKKYQHQKIHFATRTFQALRIAVNNELKNIEDSLPKAVEMLEPGGRLTVISFHSLEDRIIKNFFKEKAKENKIRILTKKPVGQSQKEIKNNPRSRSSKLRAAEKII